MINSLHNQLTNQSIKCYLINRNCGVYGNSIRCCEEKFLDEDEKKKCEFPTYGTVSDQDGNKASPFIFPNQIHVEVTRNVITNTQYYGRGWMCALLDKF